MGEFIGRPDEIIGKLDEFIGKLIDIIGYKGCLTLRYGEFDSIRRATEGGERELDKLLSRHRFNEPYNLIDLVRLFQTLQYNFTDIYGCDSHNIWINTDPDCYHISKRPIDL